MGTRPVILITGAKGQLGAELAASLRPHGEVTALTRAQLDLADADAIVRVMREMKPRIVVNAAAYTAVDRAETDRDAAFAVNARAPGVMAEECARLGALLIHYSTDYVFDGAATRPYDEDAPTGPLNVYGASKLAGEEAILSLNADALIFRTSWVYGLRGANFLLTIRRLAAQRDELRIVADQVGAPNWSRTLAQATGTLVARGDRRLRERRGLYHLSCGGQASWYEFAKAIVGEAQRPRVVPIASSEYPTPARRPAFGVLDTRRFTATFGFALPHWREALRRCLVAPAEPDGTTAVA
ncbi:MAG TPA: dTDP-4-dehydrorhamnose reductase [Casimicrobiaceae bacterium]|nr:dTDP-4-dehydrorhamnose reductase [Casimicrobiaceae bacterium]